MNITYITTKINGGDFVSFGSKRDLITFLLKVYNLEENALLYNYDYNHKIYLEKDINNIDYDYSFLYNKLKVVEIPDLAEYFGVSNIYFCKNLLDYIKSYKRLNASILKDFNNKKQQSVIDNKHWSWVIVDASKLHLIKSKRPLNVYCKELYIDNGYIYFT